MPRPICQFPGCSSTINARGYCYKHYQRYMKYGDADAGQTHAPATVRFWRFVSRTDPAACWIWSGKTERNGYGRFQIGGKGSPQVGAHRFSYEMHHGPIPDGMVVMHTCDTPGCVNPAHLIAGTHKANTSDMIAKGRHKRIAPLGNDNGKALLSADTVRMIRSSLETNAELSRRLSVSPNTIRGVRTGRTWAHVK